MRRSSPRDNRDFKIHENPGSIRLPGFFYAQNSVRLLGFKGGVIGQKELVKNPATLVKSSVAGFLSSLKQDEGWTKRVGEKCFKPLIYKAFLCLHLP